MTHTNIVIIEYILNLMVIGLCVYLYWWPGTRFYRKKPVLVLVGVMAVLFSYQFYDDLLKEPLAFTSGSTDKVALWQDFEKDALRAEGDYRLKYQELFELVIPEGYKFRTMTHQDIKLMFAKGDLPTYEAVGVVSYGKSEKGLYEESEGIIKTIKEDRPYLDVDSGKQIEKNGAVMLVTQFSERPEGTDTVGFIAFLKGNNRLITVNLSTPRLGNYFSRMRDFEKILGSMELVGE